MTQIDTPKYKPISVIVNLKPTLTPGRPSSEKSRTYRAQLRELIWSEWNTIECLLRYKVEAVASSGNEIDKSVGQGWRHLEANALYEGRAQDDILGANECSLEVDAGLSDCILHR